MATTLNVESHVRTCHLGQRLTDRAWIRSSNTSDINIADDSDVDGLAIDISPGQERKKERLGPGEKEE